MSSNVIARVRPIYKKAVELGDKGHFLHAAENYGRAAEAARALGEDNLVCVNTQLRQSAVLLGYAEAALQTGADRRMLAAYRAEGFALFSSAVAALERRRAAGTLLAGKCTAAEEAWFVCKLQLIDNANKPPAVAASLAALFGYEE